MANRKVGLCLAVDVSDWCDDDNDNDNDAGDDTDDDDDGGGDGEDELIKYTKICTHCYTKVPSKINLHH